MHYLQYGLTNEAVACFTNALYYQARRLDGNRYQESLIPRTHVRLGDIYADQKQYEEALAHYQRASALDPGSIDTLLKLGSALAILHRESEGIACFNQALRLQPNNSQAHHNLAVALRKMGREEEALQHFTEERRLSLNP